MLVAATLAVLPALAAAQGGLTKEQQGKGGSAVKGAAGTEGSKGDNGLEHCDKPMGALAVVEPQQEYMMALSRYNLQSPVSLIRMMIQQSNCFLVVERGQGLRNMEQERALAGAGQTRAGSNVGGGQMVVADFIMTPQVVFSEGNAGGVGGAVGGLLGGSKFGAVAGGLKFKEAQTTLLVADSRSGIQVASAEGSTKKADLHLGAGLFGGGGGASGGGYGNTNEGKIIAASFMDNYNKIVTVVRGDASLQRNVGTLKQEAAAGGTRKAGAVFNEGDTLGPKIAGVKMYASPNETAKVVATLGRADEMVVVGDDKDGFIEVETGSGKGWVRMTLVQKR
jgi:hypothetical protein